MLISIQCVEYSKIVFKTILITKHCTGIQVCLLYYRLTFKPGRGLRYYMHISAHDFFDLKLNTNQTAEDRDPTALI